MKNYISITIEDLEWIQQNMAGDALWIKVGDFGEFDKPENQIASIKREYWHPDLQAASESAQKLD